MSTVQSSGALTSAGGPLGWRAPAALGVRTYRYEHLSYAALYRTQPNIRTCVQLIARNAAQLGLKLYEKAADNDRIELREHPVTAMLRQPRPLESMYRFFFCLISDYLVYDDAFVLKQRAPGRGGRLALFRIPPWMMAPADGAWPDPSAWRFLGHMDQPTFDATAVWHQHGYNPDDVRFGCSPIETLRRIVAEDVASGEYREQLWNRGARKSGFVSRPKDAPILSGPARDRLKDDMRNWSGDGNEAGGAMLLEEGMTFQEAVTSFAEAEYLNARKLSRTESAVAFFIEPAIVGAGEPTRQTETDQWNGFYTNTLPPLLEDLQQGFALNVLTEFADLDIASGRHYVKFNLEAKLWGNFKDRADIISREVGAPIMSRAEGRALLELPKLDDPSLDEVIVPLNVTEGGRASPADTVPGTPGLGQVGQVQPAKTRCDQLDIDQLIAVVNRTPVKATIPTPAPPSTSIPRPDLFARALARQEKAIMSALGAGDTPEEAFDRKRWDRELARDLADHVAEPEIAARQFNDWTLEALRAAYAQTAAKHFGIDLEHVAADDPELLALGTLAPGRLDAARKVFAARIAECAGDAAYASTT